MSRPRGFTIRGRLIEPDLSLEERWITHVFKDYPVDLSTRCGLPIQICAPTVSEWQAALEAWGGAIPGLAICVGCARKIRR